MTKQFIQIVVQHKGGLDYRAFCTAKLITDDGEEIWQIRGYGSCPGSACSNAFQRFKDDHKWWDIYGTRLD